MGIVIKEIKECTCDLCGGSCGENDGIIKIQVNCGDGRDVGPATIDAKLTFTQPYGVSNGIICVKCKKKYLEKYVDDMNALYHLNT